MVGPLAALLPRFGLFSDPDGLPSVCLAGLCHSPNRIPPGRRVPIQYQVVVRGNKVQVRKLYSIRCFAAAVLGMR